MIQAIILLRFPCHPLVRYKFHPPLLVETLPENGSAKERPVRGNDVTVTPFTVAGRELHTLEEGCVGIERRSVSLIAFLSVVCFRIEEGPESRELRHAVHLLQVREALHLDGLADQAPSGRLREVAQAHMYPLRKEVQAQGLFVAPRNERSQARVKRCFEATASSVLLPVSFTEQCNETISYGDIALNAENFVQ